MVWGALIGAATSLYGMSQQEKAASKAHAQAQAAQQAALRYLDTGAGQSSALFGKAQHYLHSRIAEADRALATAGASAYRDIGAAHRQSAASASEAMARRGLGGTTAAMAAQAQAAAGAAAGYGSFWDKFAQTRQAHAMGAGSALAGLYGGRGDALYAQALDKANVMLGRQAPAATGQAEAWGKFGGMLGGALDSYLAGRGDDYAQGGKYEGYHETDAGPMGPKWEG